MSHLLKRLSNFIPSYKDTIDPTYLQYTFKLKQSKLDLDNKKNIVIKSNDSIIVGSNMKLKHKIKWNDEEVFYDKLLYRYHYVTDTDDDIFIVACKDGIIDCATINYNENAKETIKIIFDNKCSTEYTAYIE